MSNGSTPSGDPKAGIVTGDRCGQCGAVALKANRRDRRRGFNYVMAHARWCPVRGIGGWSGRQPAPKAGGRP